MRFSHLVTLNFFAIFAYGIEFCPSGSLIIVKGLTSDDEDAATCAHNNVRQRLVEGSIPDQPPAKLMKTLVYDQSLAHKVTPVTRQCSNSPLDVKDRRWPCVGQNIYLVCSYHFDPNPYWDEAVNYWFEEHIYFVFPNGNKNGKDVSHYRQLVWANTDTIGCDYQLFINDKDADQPFCKMYACNYGFCANNAANINLAPYETN